MASFNLTVEDSSPLIAYDEGAWSDSPSNDTLVSSYSGSSLHTTSTQGAKATIKFNGTGITIFGGHRQNYGSYTFSVDGQTIFTGSSSGENTVKQMLGTSSGLSNGPHTAVFMNSGDLPIDLDFVEIQTQIGKTGSLLTQTMIDDSNSRVIYSPASAWETNDKDIFSNNTLHYTNSAGASASMTFSGEAVAIYGTTSQDHADIQVMLDGKSMVFGAGSGGLASSLHTQILLYYAGDLDSNEHNLTVSADPQQGTGPFVDVDTFVVFSTSGGTPTSSTSSSPSTSAEASKSSGGISRNTLIGAVVGGVLGLLLTLTLLLLLLRWRRRQGSKGMRSPLSPTLPIQQPATLESGTGPRMSQNSMTSFYSSEPQAFFAHSRGPSTSGSTAPMIRHDEPKLAVPNPSVTRNYSMRLNYAGPSRPSTRPPSLDLPG